MSKLFPNATIRTSAPYRFDIVGSYKHPICLAFAGWFVVIIMAILSGKTIISYVSSFVS